MRDLYYACNTYYDVEKRQRYSLECEKEINETALFKVIGLTVETRPDCIDKEEIKRYIKYGVTRVQLGVQHTDDRLLKKINRRCYTNDTIQALLLLKSWIQDSLPLHAKSSGATPHGDIEMFNDIISNPYLICDEWKIYPTFKFTTTSDKDIEDITKKVMPVNTVIEKWFLDGKYKPLVQNFLKKLFATRL